MKFILITSLVSMVYVFAMDIYTKVSSRVMFNEMNYSLISVNVSGSVVSPGLYYVMDGATYGDVIYQAGGLREDADVSSIDMSKVIKEDTTIYVSSISEIVKVNINSATSKELQSIPSIGEVLANRIILYRNSNGKFKSVDEIKNVSGIGNYVYDKIVNYICID